MLLSFVVCDVADSRLCVLLLLGGEECEFLVALNAEFFKPHLLILFLYVELGQVTFLSL